MTFRPVLTLRSTRGPAALVAAVLAASLVGGCSAGGGSAAGGAAAGTPVATTTVDLPASYRFAPPAIAVAVGATVTWTNHDNFTHSVQFLDGGLPSDPLVMSPGQTATFTFDHAGTFSYQCHFHPQNMRGTVTVGP
jgi:plastocyanin